MKYKLSLLIFTIFFIAFSTFTAQGEEKTITTNGVSPAGADTSRKEAVRDALRNAVAEGMGTFVTSDLIVENKKIVDEKIFSRTEGFVKDYEILNEEESGGLYKVKIKATVKMGKIQNELKAIGLLMEQKQLPRVMILVGSSSDGESAFSQTHDWVNTVKSIVEKGFLRKKFILVDYNINIQKREIEMASGDISKIAALAKNIGAEVLVVGESARSFDSEVQFYGTTARLYRSEVQLRVVETGTGRVIFSGSKRGSPSATLDTLEESAESLTGEAIEALLKKWSSDISNFTTLLLKIKNISFPQLVKLEKSIRLIKGIENMRRRSFVENKALLEVDFVGSGNDFAERLMSLSNPHLEVTGLNQQTIDAKIKH